MWSHFHLKILLIPSKLDQKRYFVNLKLDFDRCWIQAATLIEKKIYHRVETWRDFFANKFHFEYYNYSLECWDFIFLLFRNPPRPYDSFLCLGSRGAWLDRFYWVGRGTFFFITIQASISCYISDRWKYIMIQNTVIALKKWK